MDGLTGEVKMFAGNFPPKGWAFCHGQLLPIASYSPLFSIVGTIYGGDGRTTFGLPDLRSRVPRGAGEAPGLRNTPLAQKGGRDETILTIQNLPPHTHNIVELGGDGYLAAFAKDNDKYWTGYRPGSVESGTFKCAATTTPTGAGTSFDNASPYLGINFIICLDGIFPAKAEEDRP